MQGKSNKQAAKAAKAAQKAADNEDYWNFLKWVDGNIEYDERVISRDVDKKDNIKWIWQNKT